jgi:glyoxylase-like metal-dependent hydrolase (beta-lactamase superfamily II)
LNRGIADWTKQVFARVDYQEEHELEAQIKLTGHDIKDVKAVIMGHLHLDHAGGLEHFVGTSVPIYVHEAELKHAFYSVATKTDFGVYLPHYLSFDLNWQAFTGDFLELAQGINLRHAPGHTPGLVIMQVNLANSGTWICTTDMYHVHENYEDSVSQARSHKPSPLRFVVVFDISALYIAEMPCYKKRRDLLD